MVERILHLNDSETAERFNQPINSSQLWADILYKRHPEVTDIILAYYYTNSVYKDEVQRFNVIKLESQGFLTNGSYPPPTLEQLTTYDPLLCSISSIVGTINKDLAKTYTKKPHYNHSFQLKNPMSFIQTDFSCDVSDQNLNIIEQTLDHFSYDWFILQSNASYHAIIDHLVEPDGLPAVWGDLIQNFAAQSTSNYIKEKGFQLSKSLFMNNNSHVGLRLCTADLFDRIFREIKKTKGGFEEYKKLTFIDWGHMKHSLNNLIDFFRGQSAGSSYLRISGKKGKPQPVLVSQKQNGCISRINVDPTYFTRQPPLFRIN